MTNHEQDPPQDPLWDLDAEEAILGTCMTTPYIVQHVRAVLPEPRAFLRGHHQTIYAAILDLDQNGHPTDPVAVKDYLQRAGTFHKVIEGNPAYLHDLMTRGIYAGDITHHAGIVARHWRNRESIARLQRAIREIHGQDPDDSPDRLRDLGEHLIKTADDLTTGTPGNQLAERFPRVDWLDALTADYSDIDWLPGRWLERGQQVALVGDGKVGKSLFVLDWIWRAITGRPALGDIRREPIRVLYFDRENSQRDIATRLGALGATADDFEVLQDRVDYRLFPPFSGALNASDTAAREMLAIVADTRPDVVVLDTVSRFIAGKENDSDTWLDLYRRIHEPLKGQGIASIRLDHFGKDMEKGSRGSSAKTQDVDHVWELTAYDEMRTYSENVEAVTTRLKMLRTHTRTGLGDDVFHLTRRGEKERGGAWLAGRTRHELTDATEADAHRLKIQTFVDELMMRGVPAGLGRDALRVWAKQNNVPLPGKTAALQEVVTALKVAQKS
ncbi:AAA family ATPase [Actinomadura sp. ATCC 31491]|uniref:AAA family ATPase n=1 Tax=Actinomadura luzonensis TaxID=2805427 RepID=A0ABT0G6A7_9ACTN|nr:AAA family ATPase [Actinomadura luzonensis]MCK2219735.1 AAA family ATPase [Actinomadura luzonensis]